MQDSLDVATGPGLRRLSDYVLAQVLEQGETSNGGNTARMIACLQAHQLCYRVSDWPSSHQDRQKAIMQLMGCVMYDQK